MRRARCAPQHRLLRDAIVSDDALLGNAAKPQQSRSVYQDKRRFPRNERQRWPFIMRCNNLRTFGISRTRRRVQAASAAHRREQVNGESLVEEESTDEHVVERRKRRCWTRAKRRFGRGKQTTGCAYKTTRPVLDRRLAVCAQATASPLN
jgi:hypothetical protein